MNRQFDFLSDSIVTLAEVMREAGYKTFAVSANANVSPTFGYAQGFDAFSVSTLESPFRLTMLGRTAEDVFGDVLGMDKSVPLFGDRLEIVPRAEVITDATLRWVAQGGKGPHFLYVHYIDPHWPYSPPVPYDQAFHYRSHPPLRSGGIDPLQLLSKGKDREVVGKALDRYDGEILYTDQQIGRLLKGLEEQGMLENALVIVTADHGEEFFEHGKGGHSKTLYEEVLHVPFLISWPGQIPAGATYEETVGLVDVMPTILSFLGIELPRGSQGLSFAEYLAQQAEPRSERKHFAQLINDSLSIEMVRHHDYKLIRHGRGPQQGLEELYDVQRDSTERTNLAQEERPHVEALRLELDTFNKFASQVANLTSEERIQKLDKDTERALRALGYIK
jgi:arylsulfatase A-like enzyme